MDFERPQTNYLFLVVSRHSGSVIPCRSVLRLTRVLRPDDGVEAPLAVHLVVHRPHLAVRVEQGVLALDEVAVTLLPAVVDHPGHRIVHGVLVLVVHVLRATRGAERRGEEAEGAFGRGGERRRRAAGSARAGSGWTKTSMMNDNEHGSRQIMRVEMSAISRAEWS